MTVSANPTTYPYLVSDSPPADNTFVNGPDFQYAYDAWSATWTGSPDFSKGGADPEKVITNRGQFLNCFNTSQSATLTIYAEQPLPGTPAPNFLDEVGHTWISITQTNSHGTITRVFGYYPQGQTSPAHPDDPGVLANDAGHAFDVSVTIPITGSELGQIIHFTVEHLGNTYNLDTNNCTDFVVDVCQAAGITLPQNPEEWLGGGGLCPGRLGQDLRTADIPNKPEMRDLDGGNALAQAGTCP